MGAFCVFGISRSVCRAEASRRTPTFVLEGLNRRELTVAEWAQRRDAMAQSLFEHATRTVKISPEFDAPQFCADWLATGPSEIREPKVMVRGGQGGQARQTRQAQWRSGIDVAAVRCLGHAAATGG